MKKTLEMKRTLKMKSFSDKDFWKIKMFKWEGYSQKEDKHKNKDNPKIYNNLKIKITLQIGHLFQKPVSIFLYSFVKNIISIWTYFITNSGNFMMAVDE